MAVTSHTPPLVVVLNRSVVLVHQEVDRTGVPVAVTTRRGMAGMAVLLGEEEAVGTVVMGPEGPNQMHPACRTGLWAMAVPMAVGASTVVLGERPAAVER